MPAVVVHRLREATAVEGGDGRSLVQGLLEAVDVVA
jgi:hypothetical protein